MGWDERIGRRVKLWDLSILLTAIEARSMSKAAEQLRVSQPAISKTIAALESRIGAELVVRSSRGIEATPRGRALLDRSRAALKELTDAVDDMAILSDPKSGELSIAANEVALSGLVGTVINRLYARYPGIFFEIVPAYTHAAQMQELQQRRVELVIGQIPQSGVDHSIEASELFQDELVVAASSRSAWARRKKIDLRELLEEPWAFSPPNTISGRSMEQAFRASGLDLPRIIVIASSMQLLRRLAMNDNFLALFPSSVVRRADDLTVLPVEIKSPWQPIGILTAKHRTLSPLAKLFIEYARKVVEDLRPNTAARPTAKA